MLIIGVQVQYHTGLLPFNARLLRSPKLWLPLPASLQKMAELEDILQCANKLSIIPLIILLVNLRTCKYYTMPINKGH